MLLPLLFRLVVLPLCILQASATQFCQCEHPADPEWKFSGINQICHELPNEWCSTNCNSFNKNCDYCQFTPAGQGPDQDYQRLVAWCRNQGHWDSLVERYIRGTDVFCYSYKNRNPPGFGYGGCDHQDNGDYPRDRTAYLRLRLKGGWYQRRGCSNLQWSDWQPVADDFIKRNPQCQAYNNDTLRYTIDCPYTENDKENLKERSDFKASCESQKGKWYLRHDGPDLMLSQALQDEVDVQRPLGSSAKFPPLMGHHNAGAGKETQLTAVNSGGDCHGQEKKGFKKTNQGPSSRGGSRRVVYEEDDMRVIVVEEEEEEEL